MNIVILVLLFAFFLLLEGTALHLLMPSVAPDFLFVFIVCAAFLSGEKKGALLGFVAGLFQDLLFSSAIGYFALPKMLVGYLVGLLGKEIHREQVVAPAFLAFLFTFLHETMLYLLVEQFIGAEFAFIQMVRLFFVPKAFLHIVLVFAMYPLLYRVSQKKGFFDRAS